MNEGQKTLYEGLGTIALALAVLTTVGFSNYCRGREETKPKEVYPIKINGTNGYQIISEANMTNYYIYAGRNHEVSQIDIAEEVTTLENRLQTITNTVPVKNLKYRLEEIK